MELKSYQQTALNALTTYLENLRLAETKREMALAVGIPYEWDKDAWRNTVGERAYHGRTAGNGEAVPTLCFKIPTGGGKTLLAAHAVNSLKRFYGTRAGLVLWVVPTSQIYAQTLGYLRDRAHPYRQLLDSVSGGNTLVLEKDATFGPADAEARLIVLLLMLPAANRQTRETLRMFRDRGGFEAFFPPEDDYAAVAAIQRRIPNLDSYADTGLGAMLKHSLGNTLRLLRPIIVLDEGHKAYSRLAQETLLGFNPHFILELSATPPPTTNVLVTISGRAVHQEGMIKLDLNLHTLATNDWRDVLRTSVRRRDELEQTAERHHANTGTYIRPIMLIQVERTGREQRDSGRIHAEDVREFLISQSNVHPTQIAVKSSEKDEIERIDLLSQDCAIRYIITKHALQEGWDCPFAYVLTVLTNTHAKTGLTQLIGRVLRQPYARKTGQQALDESYAYCYRKDAGALTREIIAGFNDEGLGDVAGQIINHSEQTAAETAPEWAAIRPEFSAWAGNVYLPCFVVPNGAGGWREINYEVDVLSRVPWDAVDLTSFDTLVLHATSATDSVWRIGIDSNLARLSITDATPMLLDPVYLTRQLNDVVPNPWVGFALVTDTLRRLRLRWSDAEIVGDLGFVLDELQKRIIAEKRRLGKQVFLELVNTNQLKFFLIHGCAGNAIPERIKVRGARRLNRASGEPLQRSLFEPLLEDDFNNLEQTVALYLDHHEWVLWWWRNLVKSGYSIQAWQAQRIYSDFVVLGRDVADESPEPINQIYVLETKGIHLKNEDTDYKREVFALCNALTEQDATPWSEIANDFSDHKVHFQVVFEDEWQRILNALFHNQHGGT